MITMIECQYLGDLFKVMIYGLPSNRGHIVKKGHLLKSFRPQNLEHNVHDDKSLQRNIVMFWVMNGVLLSMLWMAG